MSKTKEELTESLQSSNESERLYAVEDILDSPYIEMAEDLIERLPLEKSPVVKNSIISVLQKMDYPPAYPKLFQFFADEDPFLRNSTVALFAKYGEDALHFLVAYIDHANKEIRKLILDSLVEIAISSPRLKKQVLDVFRASLHDPDINVVITAVEYMAKLEDKESREDLNDLYDRIDEPMLRVTIIDFFIKIGEKEDLELSLKLISNGDLNNIESLYMPQAIRILGKLGDKDEFFSLVSSLSDLTYYSEDIVFSLDSLCRMGLCESKESLEILKKISKKKNLREETKFTCVKLLLTNPTEENIGFVKEWSENGSNEFKDFCRETILAASNG